MKKYILFILTITILACSKNDDKPSAIDTFHQDYYELNIAPALQNFKNDIELQISLIETFKENNSIENLQEIQNQWLVGAQSFSKLSAYNVADVKALFFDIIIYNSSINTSKIEENILEKTIFDSAYFSSKSTVTKGLGALEYLLYNTRDSDMAFSLLNEDTYRIDYMLGLSKEVLEQTNLLINFWEFEYKETFINATGVSCRDNARCLAFNQLINVIDVIRVTKVGKPAGLDSSSNIDVESLEAYRSENSLSLIKSSLEEIENAYGNSTVNFSNIVDEIGGSSEVSEAINAAFIDVNSKIEAIDTSLYSAILNKDPKVELLYESLFDLVKYFSADAASILSVTVIPTDNDGD